MTRKTGLMTVFFAIRTDFLVIDFDCFLTHSDRLSRRAGPWRIIIKSFCVKSVTHNPHKQTILQGPGSGMPFINNKRPDCADLQYL